MVIGIVNAQYDKQMADYDIFPNMEYVPSESYNIIINITSISVPTLVQCTQKCLEYVLCETATFYIQTHVCVLYRERYGLGRLVTVTAQTASMISLNYRNPSGNVKIAHHNSFFK